MTTLWNFIVANRTAFSLGAAWVFSCFVSSLPEPNQPWTKYEVFYKFVNGVAANLPQKAKVPAIPIKPMTVPVSVSEVVATSVPTPVAAPVTTVGTK